MASPKHFNPASGSPPYKSLFSNVTICPARTSLAYVSTQWAADPATGELVEGVENDYSKQSKIVWENIVGILKELGAGMKDVCHFNVSFKEFSDDIGKQAVEAMISVTPEEWIGDIHKSSLSFNGVAFFHRPGMVYAVDLVVSVPALH